MKINKIIRSLGNPNEPVTLGSYAAYRQPKKVSYFSEDSKPLLSGSVARQGREELERGDYLYVTEKYTMDFETIEETALAIAIPHLTVRVDTAKMDFSMLESVTILRSGIAVAITLVDSQRKEALALWPIRVHSKLNAGDSIRIENLTLITFADWYTHGWR